MLQRILELDHRSLTVSRSPDARLVGCCRDYAVLLCSVLRERGIPARVRFGFAGYFRPDFLCDHVVTEYWDDSHGRWILVDAEIDNGAKQEYGIAFNPLDVPRDSFLVAGDAWQRCRRGELEPQQCGLDEEICGWPFIARYVTHDLAALAGVEVLPWDGWGLTDIPPNGSLDEEECVLIDGVAAATTEGTTQGFAADPRFAARGTINSYSAAGFHSVTLP